MSRTVNEKRPAELLETIHGYLLANGISDLSLRPLAKAVGVSPRILLYYFGSREKMLVLLFDQIRQRQRAFYGRPQAGTYGEACRAAWDHMMASGAEPGFRLFFEAYGVALRNPELYKEFLHSTIEDWLGTIAAPLTAEGVGRNEARAFATIVLTGIRGFMLDYCTTHDRERVDRAVYLWSQALDTIALQPKKELI
jgi:AcrR family transcriptional regulator